MVALQFEEGGLAAFVFDGDLACVFLVDQESSSVELLGNGKHFPGQDGLEGDSLFEAVACNGELILEHDLAFDLLTTKNDLNFPCKALSQFLAIALFSLDLELLGLRLNNPQPLNIAALIPDKEIDLIATAASHIFEDNFSGVDLHGVGSTVTGETAVMGWFREIVLKGAFAVARMLRNRNYEVGQYI